MSIEILVNAAPRETRAALLENGALQELFIERASRRGLVSNLYKGRVSRVLPGMQAAFLEIGLSRTAFLHVADILGPPPDPVNDAQEPRDPAHLADIRALVREGDELLVQVVKDPIGTKGARLSTHVSLPSRYLVFMPRGSRVGVSARIESEPERNRLRELVSTLSAQSEGNGGTRGGYIVRTAALGAPLEALHADMMYLQRLWTHVRERAAATAAGNLVHEDLPLTTRVLRDELRPEVRRVLVDSPAEFARMQDFTRAFMPEFEGRIELHQASRPIFDLHGIEDEINRALDARVPLKSGGHIVIQQTEAMTTVDVNTGGYVGHRNLEETIFRTNLEAAVTIARQLRVRNLGGIIVLDFIDMQNEQHRAAVLEEFKRALARDRTRITVNGFTALGLVEMTRKRTRESLAHVLCEPCPTCQGRGEVKTADTVCYEILREILREARAFGEAREFRILASQNVIDRFLEEEAPSIEMLSNFIGKRVSMQVESSYTQEQFDIVLM
jgi:ribonuclease G